VSRSEAPNSPSSAATNQSDPDGILRPLPAPPVSTGIDLDALQPAARADPANGRAWYDLGYALNRSGKPQEAVSALDCALTLAPDHAGIICERAIALLALRSLAEASDAFEEVLALQPLSDLALFGLANVK
jgi:tetratricopeptide (TPR) repeat protein